MREGEVCALGSVAVARGEIIADLDPYDHDSVAARFGISNALAREIMYENDDDWRRPTPEQRFENIRAWVVANLKEPE